MKTIYDLKWGSHLPALIKVMSITTGDVLEMGIGLYSTPFLHWACHSRLRHLVSYEGEKECYEMNKNYHGGFHEVYYVENWNDAKIEKNWDVVLIDHAPFWRRKTDIKRLAGYAKYIVIHDSNRYDFSSIWPLFKYRYDYKKTRPNTTVVSNFYDLSSLDI
jgi:hypothetical protein